MEFGRECISGWVCAGVHLQVLLISIVNTIINLISIITTIIIVITTTMITYPCPALPVVWARSRALRPLVVGIAYPAGIQSLKYK